MGRILGLDTTEHAVRGAILTTAIRRVELTEYVEAEIAPASDPEGQRAALREAIQVALAGLSKPPDVVIASIDGREVSLRRLELPGTAAKRIDDVLPFELEAVLPFAIDEAVIDHQPIATAEGKLHILAAAVPRDRVERRLSELRSAGVDPKELAAGAATLDGLLPLLSLLATPGPHLLVHIDRSESDITVLRNGVVELARTLSLGVDDVARGKRGELEAEIRRTVIGYRASGGPNITSAFLSGDAALSPNAVEWLGTVLEVETHVLPLPVARGTDDTRRPLFGRAVALAGRAAVRGKHLNLRTGDFAPKRALGALQENAKLIGICTGIVFAAFVFSTYARYSLLADERESLHAELSQATDELFGEEIDDIALARRMIEGGGGSDDPLPKFNAFDVLNEISARIPAEITHDTRRLVIEYDDEARHGHFELQGTVASLSERDNIAQQLEAHECFKEMQKGRTTPGPGNEGLNYQLETEVVCPGDEQEKDDD